MPESTNLKDKGFKNIVQNGQITGFQIRLQLSYYRGISLSLIEGFDVTVDGETFARDQVKCTIGNRNYTQDELEKVNDPNVRWPWLEPCTLTVGKPGGLAQGIHAVKVVEKHRVSYMETSPQSYTFTRSMTMVV